MRLSNSFRRSSKSLVEVRHILSLQDAVDKFERTGVFELQPGESDSYDFKDKPMSDVSIIDIQGVVKDVDLLVAASTQMKKQGSESQSVHMNTSAPPVAAVPGPEGVESS